MNLTKFKERIDALSAGIGIDIKAIQLKIKEFSEKITALEEKAQNSSSIDDASPSHDKSYSSRKIDALIASERLTTTQGLQSIKHEILDGADAAYDTLKEVAAYINEDKSTGAALALAVGHRIRFDDAQILTPEQQRQARLNIGIEDIDEPDFLGVYNTAKGNTA